MHGNFKLAADAESTLYIISDECAPVAYQMKRGGRTCLTASPEEAVTLGSTDERVVLVFDAVEKARWKRTADLLKRVGVEVHCATVSPSAALLISDGDALAQIDQAVVQWDDQIEDGPAWKRRIIPITAHELIGMKLEPLENLMSPWLPVKGLAMIYGPRGTGKTYVAHGIACSVAAGRSFLGWSAPKPRRVVVFDGEMPAPVLQERIAQVIASGGYDFRPECLKLCAADLEPDGLPDLASPEAQRYFDTATADADLIVVDNLSTLAPGVRENEADSWVPVQAWALRQRRQGRSVLFVHHAGKGGNQRGTSRKEDVLNTVIALRRPPDYSPSQGARFEVHYEKARGFHGQEAEPFEASLRDGEWVMADLKRGDDDETIARLHKQGLSLREISERTGVSKSSVERRLKRRDP